VVTLAGGAEPGDSDGARDMARFRNPVNVTVGHDGNIYIADFDNGLGRRATAEGVVTTLTADSLGFSRPFGMTVAPDGSIYIQTDFNANGDWGAGALWVVAPGSNHIELLKDDIGRTRGLLALPDGRVMMSHYVDHVILLFDPGSRAITRLAGSPGLAGYRDGRGADARFNSPYGLALLETGVVAVADRGNNRLRTVTLDGNVGTLAGNGMGQVQDGPLDEASFDMPQGLAGNAAGTLYVSSINGYVIRAVAGGQVTTIAGDGSAGFADAENPLEARFNGLEGIGISPEGDHLYIADGSRGENEPYHRVRRLTLQ
jgi:sugar lactone lactonase YvrE